MNILVTGGAGYIGSETVALLAASGHRVTVLDSLEYGHAESLVKGVRLFEGRIDDRELLDRILSEQQFDGVIHFAAYIQVGESVKEPSKYFANNVAGSLVLFDALVRHGVKRVVFSSTAAVYGNPVRVPIEEQDAKQPTNPYGASKLMMEQMLHWMDASYGLKSVCLRYFNASGAALDGSRGESHQPETHLIPLVLAAAAGNRDSITLFGQDYQTPDGTCVRDYIHVADLASAHLKALEYLVGGGGTAQFNVGTGHGYSNQELVAMAKKVTGVEFAVEYGDRRPGDPDQLIASNDKIRAALGWEPQHSDLETILRSAWNWHTQHPDGYEENSKS
jgi:UDP-glucose 4-epimerase